MDLNVKPDDESFEWLDISSNLELCLNFREIHTTEAHFDEFVETSNFHITIHKFFKNIHLKFLQIISEYLLYFNHLDSTVKSFAYESITDHAYP